MAEGTAAKPLRCAVYTRKSSEEGLDQAFNSLHAQREACSAYVLSQKHEGWLLSDKAYDDGGYSGGSMDRPGLRALLADIMAGLVDVVVVYKVDRLTRSLADFAKIVDALDAHKASFVSITQAFNTTTSMGRLTLNVLLSFAQFEREVTGERIRDKIAASKKKGMWMGGTLPLGYDTIDRKLIIVEPEAQTVRWLFDRYLQVGSVDALKKEADQAGFTSKLRTTAEGRISGGARFSRGALYHLLSNPIYVGEISHKGVRHPGEHAPIITRAQFDTVQARLNERAADRRSGIGLIDPSLLVGLMTDSQGQSMTPSHTLKRGRRYRYYVARAEIGAKPVRYPAGEVEQAVVDELVRAFADPLTLLGGNPLPLSSDGLSNAHRISHEIAGANGSALRMQLRECLRSVAVDGAGMTITLCGRFTADLLCIPALANPVLRILRRRKRAGGEVRLLKEPDQERYVDQSLIGLLAKGQTWFDRLCSGAGLTSAEIAKQAGVTPSYVHQLVELAFLAPDLKLAILNGRQPAGLTANKLKTLCPLPSDWEAQRRLLGSL